MTWSIEPLEGGQYGIVKTEGRTSRTVYLATCYGDAAQLLVMAEVYDLVSPGVPVELFQKTSVKTSKEAKATPKRKTAKK